MKDGVVVKRELKIQKDCKFEKLYNWQRAQKRDKEFVLHDGPPYANGSAHVGHAINKILKDITNRYKLLRGHRVSYIPGWDCHGMPIEQKALAEARADHKTMKPLEIRKKARLFAEKTIRTQMASFQRWGVMADWERGCYYTFDRQYEADQLDVFYQMYRKDLIYQGYMPVYWSPSSRTALAEAELEYNEEHVSPSVYIKFPIMHLPDSLRDQLRNQLGSHMKPYAVIWTTTPWTLPANEAICYGNKIKYCFVRQADSKNVFLICTEFVDKFSEIVGEKFHVLFTFDGKAISSTRYCHPFQADKECPMFAADYVTIEKGTGLVHTAPAHGHDDFKMAMQHKLPVDCIVNEDGAYMDAAGTHLAGKEVLGDGNRRVLELMADRVMHQEDFKHSYPYDWRTKLPVIIRASKQWFVKTGVIKDKALACLSDISITPPSSGQGMLSQLDRRPYWCISRQRVWGVPIPVFYEKLTGEVLLSRASLDHIRDLVLKHGSECWWTLPLSELLPDSVIQESGFDTEKEFVRGDDILDIWFDSGSSWATVLKDSHQMADVYLEGLDQFGGWFQSSLLTSVAVRDKPPYKSLVVHGFAVDENGQKMSKSVGNVVDPNVIINGGKDRRVKPAYGADLLRWWAAQSNLDPQVYIGDTILHKCNEQIFKVRKSLRFIMGNLHDFDIVNDLVAFEQLTPQDKYLLHCLHRLCLQVTDTYDRFNYTRALNLVEKFVNIHVSFYNHITKDRLYCSHHDNLSRRSAQTVQYYLLEALTKFIAPVVPHLAEEIYKYHPYNAVNESLFHTSWFTPQDEWNNPQLQQTFDVALSLRDTFNEEIGPENPVEFDLAIAVSPKLHDILQTLQEDSTSHWSSLVEVLQCSTASLLNHPPAVLPDESTTLKGITKLINPDGSVDEQRYLLVVMPAENYECQRCRRYTAIKENELCQRCSDVVIGHDMKHYERSRSST